MKSKLSPMLVALLVTACSAGSSTSSGTPGGSGGGGTDATGGATPGGSGPGGATSGGGGTGAGFIGTGGATGNCNDPDADNDQDGFTIEEGDCNDCDPLTNPGAIEFVGPAEGGAGGGGGGSGGNGEGGYIPVDENCNGEADEAPPPPCDDLLALNSSDPLDAARAIDICKLAAGPKDWGLVAAQYVRANGGMATVNGQMGLLQNFGPNVPPLRGSSLLGLSSGFARLPGQPGACTNISCTRGSGNPSSGPPGFPQAVPGCIVDNEINDDVGLELTLRAPTNATGYRFNFKFTSFEYPEFVCTSFNDQFIAFVNPPPMGAQDGNIAFDSMGNPVSVNIAFFDVCANCTDAECMACMVNADQLLGTGFDTGFGGFPNDAGGTSWLQTQAPVTGGSSFSIRFAIFDVGDTAYDSTAVIDHFDWIADGGEVPIETVPVE